MDDSKRLAQDIFAGLDRIFHDDEFIVGGREMCVPIRVPRHSFPQSKSALRWDVSHPAQSARSSRSRRRTAPSGAFGNLGGHHHEASTREIRWIMRRVHFARSFSRNACFPDCEPHSQSNRPGKIDLHAPSKTVFDFPCRTMTWSSERRKEMRCSINQRSQTLELRQSTQVQTQRTFCWVRCRRFMKRVLYCIC